MTALLSIPAGLFFILCCFIPNSPYWLVEKNRLEEAQASLSWLRGGQNSDFQEEFQEMVEKKRAKDEENLNNKPGICGAFSNGRFWRPFLRIAFLMCLTEWAGMNVIAQYMVIIFRESGSAIAPTVAPIIVAGVRVGLACVSTFILRYSPRKPLFLTCCVLIFLSYMALGGFNFCKAKLQEDKSQSEEYLSLISKLGWVPLLSVMTVQAAQTIGFLSVLHFNLQAESFPTDLRSTACGLVGMVTALTRFVTTKLFPQLTEWFGYHGVFWFYGVFVAIIFFYAIKIMPENKGKSLVQTESNFAKK